MGNHYKKEMMNSLKHLAIIMDGNGRWASKRGLPRSLGHRQGVKNVDAVINLCIDAGIPVLSLYVFSTENWRRPKEEVEELLKIIREYFHKLEKYEKMRAKIIISGSREGLSPDLLSRMDEASVRTAHNDRITLNLCFNYGGREEIVSAVKAVYESRIAHVDEAVLLTHMYTGVLPDVDFIIRTGGQKRLSNFMLFKAAYAELYFTDCLWPDFGKREFTEALADYEKRVRNFGSV